MEGVLVIPSVNITEQLQKCINYFGYTREKAIIKLKQLERHLSKTLNGNKILNVVSKVY